MRRLLFFVALAIGLLGLFAAPALASAETFYVHPSGGNDTANIQAAFNAAVKAGPGSTVQLSAGHFYTNNIVVRSFHGYFKGAGEGRTVIDCLRGLDPTLPGVTLMPDIAYFPFLVCFYGGHFSVSDMSFDITAFSPAEPWNAGGPPDSDFLGSTVIVYGNTSPTFERVGFSVGDGNDNGYNSDEDLYIGSSGPTDAYGDPLACYQITGTESVCDCSFSGHDGLQLEGLAYGMATVSGNVFDTGGFGCLLLDGTASQITFSHNQMQAPNGESLLVLQGWQANFGGGAGLPPLPAPHYLICDNNLFDTGYAGGVWLEDDSCFYNDAPDRLDATIADNTITLDNGGWDAGIEGYYARGIKVLDNHISGVGDAAIDVGTGPFFGMNSGPTVGWQIIGNDVSGVTPSDAIWDSRWPRSGSDRTPPIALSSAVGRPPCSTRAPTTP